MKNLALITLFALISTFLSAQQNGILFQRLIGGSLQDGLNSAITVDGGFILSGYTTSTDGDMTDTVKGSLDVLIMKVDTAGSIIWQHTYGGTGSDQNAKIMKTNDGGYIVSALTSSDDGDLTANYGGNDMWVFKIDSIGSLLWQKNFGGFGSDEPQNIYATSDGFFLLTGRTFSTNGDITFNHGSSDIWVVKIDSIGNMVWQKTYGSTAGDDAFAVVETADGFYAVYGNVNANNGDVTGSNGGTDTWLFKVEPMAGNLIWQKCFGGSAIDNAQNMIITNDGGFALTGFTFSSDSIFNSNHGNMDAFLIKTDANGNLEWVNNYGGGNVEIPKGITELNDGTFILSINSQSTDGDVLGNHGVWDGWLINFDNTGTILWQRSYGGTSADYLMKVFPLDSNQFAAFGYTNSNDGDVTGNHGASDIWWLTIRPQNIITGNIFIDLNQNGIKEGNEPFSPNTLVRTFNSTWDYSSLTSDLGNYVNYADSGMVTTEVITNGYFNSNPVSSSYNGFGQTDTINFALTAVPGITDVSVSLIPLRPARPGFMCDYHLVYTNLGTEPASGTIMIIKSQNVVIDSIEIQPDSINGDTLFWNYNSLSILTSVKNYIRLTIAPPPVVNIGDTLNFITSISTLNPDTFIQDNTHVLNQLVSGSYDPNDKTCSEENVPLNSVQNGLYFEYLIRFQNTGTDTAFTVRITDVLDPALMISTFQLINCSHACKISMQDSLIKFSFENILLPDSNVNETASHGYVLYRIMPEPSSAAGVDIHNTANIYFDYNEAVITNTTHTVITISSSLEENESYFLGTYPNPATNSITLFLENSNTLLQDITITDLAGKSYKSEYNSLSGNYYDIDLSSLSTGLYLITVTTSTGRYTAKVVKE